MKEIYDETNKLLKFYGTGEKTSVETDLLGWWWGLWLINGIFGNVIFQMSRRAITIEQLSTNTMLSIINVLLGIVLSLITIKVIKDYATIEPNIFDIQDAEFGESQTPIITTQ